MTCGRPLTGTIERHRPRVDLGAVLAPELLSGALVESGDERLALVIPLDDEAIAEERRRAAFAERVAHLLVAEILLPDELAVHVVGVVPERVERRDHVLAVGRGRGRRPGAVLRMRRLVRRLFLGDALPQDFAGLPIEREDDELVRDERLTAARRVRRVAGDADRHALTGRTHDRPRRRVTPSRGRESRPSTECSSSRSIRSAASRSSKSRCRAARATAANSVPQRAPAAQTRPRQSPGLPPPQEPPRFSLSSSFFAFCLVSVFCLLPWPWPLALGLSRPRRQSAPRTSSACPSTLTLSQRLATLPSGPIK